MKKYDHSENDQLSGNGFRIASTQKRRGKAIVGKQLFTGLHLTVILISILFLSNSSSMHFALRNCQKGMWNRLRVVLLETYSLEAPDP